MAFERLKGKVIVISGGTKGVGRAFAEVAGREGARVVIGGRDEKAGKEAVRNIRTFGSDGMFVHTDLRSETAKNCSTPAMRSSEGSTAFLTTPA